MAVLKFHSLGPRCIDSGLGLVCLRRLLSYQSHTSLLAASFNYYKVDFRSFRGGSVVENLFANAGGAQETQVRSLGWEDPLE